MKKNVIKTIAVILAVLLIILSGCGNAAPAGNSSKVKINIAYQGGIGYAPIHVMEVNKLIEKYYDGDIEITYQKLDSGAAINEGMIGGNIQIGCMGVAPAVSGVAAGIDYKIISNLCAQSHGLMSNDPEIRSLSDIGEGDVIALVGTGSIQHILLAMTAEKVLGDAHALDNNIQKMSHAEGMAALESGTVKLHLTSSPFIYQERENPAYNELSELSEVWPSGNTFLVAMASSQIMDDPKLFEAVKAAFKDAIDFINENRDETVAIEAEYLALEPEQVREYLEQPDCIFSTELKGVQDMADFMFRAGFVEKEVSMDDLVVGD